MLGEPVVDTTTSSTVDPDRTSSTQLPARYTTNTKTAETIPGDDNEEMRAKRKTQEKRCFSNQRALS